jgi:transposase
VAKRQENGSTILLGLKEYKVTKVTEEETGIIAEVKVIGVEKVNCPRCGSTKLDRHGLDKTKRGLHSWSNGKRVHLEIRRRRWRCRESSRSFNDGAEIPRPYYGITRQYEPEVLRQLKDRSSSQVKRDLRQAV